jgi:hypothetical protein
MPLDYGCWFDQHHGVEDLRPNPVKPHPEEPVCADQPRATWSLPPQDGHLMSQGDEFKLQGGAAANTEREQGNEGFRRYGDICLLSSNRDKLGCSGRKVGADLKASLAYYRMYSVTYASNSASDAQNLCCPKVVMNSQSTGLTPQYFLSVCVVHRYHAYSFRSLAS